MTIQLDMIQSMGLAVIFLLLGKAVKSKVSLFSKYAIPSPVIGGLIFSIIHMILRQSNVASFEFNTTLQTFFQIMFFCTIGFNASLKMLKIGGKKVLIFLLIAAVFAVLQNVVAVGLAKVVGINPLLALLTASPALTGGHGTSAAVAPSIEALGYPEALTVALTAATFGLVAGSLLGSPMANRLIIKDDLVNKKKTETSEDNNIDLSLVENKKTTLDTNKFSMAFFQIIIAMALGTYLTTALNQFVGQWVTGVAFPSYIGAMLVAAVIRNISDSSNLFKTHMQEIEVIGEVSLNLFLGMALITLKLWQLIDLALPMLVLLLAQCIMMYLYGMFVSYRIMGRNYDSAVMVAGLTGFGMGSASNAMANMNSVTEKYVYSKTAFFVVPIVGSLFIDFINIGIIYGFIGFLS
ncbi:sodium/glutamate symporter [Clostridium cylindrosporum]|uniref:Sodium/glutamate symporter n=1 Tax=Clostridium cylindrosporum DSM 605 TaxID=1121307 RepID=A0A0J8D771_CLOCY|nr:sodium/glutamate symporter [Clostridium cylindrosporum]KMT21915.1 sodium/glutamate symport carrier protein GltS [Clostridium cylindrosporum DSM 605]